MGAGEKVEIIHRHTNVQSRNTAALIITTAYTAAFPQSGSSSVGIQVISVSDIGQTASTGEIPLLFLRIAVGSLKSPVLG